MTTRQGIRGRSPWVWALAGVFVVGLLVVAVLTWNGKGDQTGAPTTSTTTTTTTQRTTIVTSTTSSSAVATSTTTPPRTTTPRTITITPSPGGVPGAVIADAHSSGGSEEVQVDWNAATGATAYRVLRTGTDGGQGRVVADFDITTGRATAAPEVVNIWSADYSYVPPRGAFTGTDDSPWFQYVDVGPGRRCYRIQAYNAAGAGPPSAVTCGSPLGSENQPPVPR